MRSMIQNNVLDPGGSLSHAFNSRSFSPGGRIVKKRLPPCRGVLFSRLLLYSVRTKHNTKSIFVWVVNPPERDSRLHRSTPHKRGFDMFELMQRSGHRARKARLILLTTLLPRLTESSPQTWPPGTRGTEIQSPTLRTTLGSIPREEH